MGFQQDREFKGNARTLPLRFHAHYVLGSRSPRRLELLRQIVPAEAIEVLPPRRADEAGFTGLSAWPPIAHRLEQIVRVKCEDVLEQLKSRPADPARMVITADTIVVVGESDDRLRVLGQPPDDASWPDVVRRWFREHYAGKTHTVATQLCVAPPDRPPLFRIVKSSVTFYDDVDRWLEWYLTTGESRGKAGGYALQEAGSIFVSKIDGSLSNVVGLPLRELQEILATAHFAPE
jgi:septum formation protein